MGSILEQRMNSVGSLPATKKVPVARHVVEMYLNGGAERQFHEVVKVKPALHWRRLCHVFLNDWILFYDSLNTKCYFLRFNFYLYLCVCSPMRISTSLCVYMGTCTCVHAKDRRWCSLKARVASFTRYLACQVSSEIWTSIFMISSKCFTLLSYLSTSPKLYLHWEVLFVNCITRKDKATFWMRPIVQPITQTQCAPQPHLRGCGYAAWRASSCSVEN